MANDKWETPPELFRELHEEFDFKLDVCAEPHTAKCPIYFTESEDGLKQDWHKYGTCWMNPPYSNIFPWVQKAYTESVKGVTVVALLPGDTSTKWFHDWVYHNASLRFKRGRVRFLENGKPSKNSPKFASIIAIYEGWKHVQQSDSCGPSYP